MALCAFALGPAAYGAEPAPARIAPASFDWTGFYLGAHLGYTGGGSHWTANPIY